MMNGFKKTAALAVGAMVFALATGANAHGHEHDKDVMKADANNDGKVSFAEFKAAHEAKLKARFERKDINKDGFIDREEKQVAKQKRKQKAKERKEALQQSKREALSEERKTRKRHFYKY